MPGAFSPSFIPIGSRLSTETFRKTPITRTASYCFIPIGSRLSTETLSNAVITAVIFGFIPIGSRLSTETRVAGGTRLHTYLGFIPIGSRLSTETALNSRVENKAVLLHPHRLAVEH